MFLKKDRESLDKDFDDYDWLDDLSEGNLSVEPPEDSGSVVATDVAAVGTGRRKIAACGYGFDKGIFGYGTTAGAGLSVDETNLVSNVGVVSADVTGVGTARHGLSATQYGGDKGIFGYGYHSGNKNMTNLVTNVGVVGTDVTGVGTARAGLAACSFN